MVNFVCVDTTNSSLRGGAKPQRGNLRNFILLHEIATLSTFARNDG
ncbi:hypothetical protein RAMDARK_0610 [Rickettsia amblyommatis str. Darkwater]|nr:hypothetical protein RAMDARK_0610 [Rickettsia amblyommatis str. Darkwater]